MSHRVGWAVKEWILNSSLDTMTDYSIFVRGSSNSSTSCSRPSCHVAEAVGDQYRSFSGTCTFWLSNLVLSRCVQAKGCHTRLRTHQIRGGICSRGRVWIRWKALKTCSIWPWPSGNTCCCRMPRLSASWSTWNTQTSRRWSSYSTGLHLHSP